MGPYRTPAKLSSWPKKSWRWQADRLTQLARLTDPAVKLLPKDNWFCWALAYILVVITFGGIRPHDFIYRFATTIGPLQFYPEAWTVYSVERICIHEGRHTRQARWFGLGIHPWVGLPLFAVFYLVLPLPLGLAWFRYRFELDASKYAWRVGLERGLYDQKYVRVRATQFGNTVCSGKYGWAFPKRWGVKQFKRAAEAVCAEYKAAA